MKIKKVDEKPMVIHTKQKAKIHTYEPKQASIKGSNIFIFYGISAEKITKNC